jgi:serine/threonine-protein kinase RsbW
MTAWVTLRLPSAAHVVGIARSMVVASASAAGLGRERIEDVRMCASEAVTNAVQAHRRVEVTSPVVVRTTVVDGRFIVEVADSGPGITAAPPREQDDGLPAEGGYGIPVMRSLSDSFDISAGGLLDPASGTTVRMTFLLEPAPAADAAASVQHDRA